jgi:GTP cyclohydrolase IIa
LTIQITLVKIEGYGSWTLGLGSDRESQLQMLQAKLYYDLQKVFSDKECIVFQNRLDELVTITNGLSPQDHNNIYSYISDLYKEISLSMSVGIGQTPLDASISAYNCRKDKLSINKGARLYSDCNMISGSSSVPSDMMVQILHLDLDDSTGMTRTISPYEVSTFIIGIYSRMAEAFLILKNLTFYLGGDNFMVVSNPVTLTESKLVISKICQQMNINLNCGVGLAFSARGAVRAATEALDTVRRLRGQGKIQNIYEIDCL